MSSALPSPSNFTSARREEANAPRDLPSRERVANAPRLRHLSAKFSAFVQDALFRSDKWILERIWRAAGRPPIRLAVKNSAEVPVADVPSVAKIVIHDRKTTFNLICDPEVAFADAYSDGRITIEGDLTALLESFYRSTSARSSQNWYSRFVSRYMDYAQRNSVRRARINVRRHYDLSNEFFSLWLDAHLVYSCAYFSSASMSLEDAQVAKMDYICRKLNLQPGERVVDVGSGWGALALHMAEHYGVKVRGFSVAHEQIVWARDRANELGLNNRVEFIEDDYRNISGKCDVLVSVGMLEHVGPEHYGEMGRVIENTLDRAGRGLLQSIGRNCAMPFSNWTRKRIFPGAYAPTLRQMMDLFEPWRFSILDVENLRAHYERTLEHWLARFEASRDKVSAMFGAEFVRAWRLYLSGAIAGFRLGTLQLFQIVFARTDSQQIPSTRVLYCRAPTEVRLTPHIFKQTLLRDYVTHITELGINPGYR